MLWPGLMVNCWLKPLGLRLRLYLERSELTSCKDAVVEAVLLFVSLNVLEIGPVGLDVISIEVLSINTAALMLAASITIKNKPIAYSLFIL